MEMTFDAFTSCVYYKLVNGHIWLEFNDSSCFSLQKNDVIIKNLNGKKTINKNNFHIAY